MRTHIAVDILFLLSVTVIWFMVGYQLVLFLFGHIYYRRTREGKEAPPPLADEDCPGVSILIPCRNEERVIAHTIRALLELDYPTRQIEIVVINDGSTDRTEEVANGFNAVARVQVVNVPPEKAARGKSSALNYGIKFAHHSIIAIYDADNVPERGALRPLVSQLISNPKLAAALGMYRAWNRHRALVTRFVNIESIAFQWILQAGRWMLLRVTTLPGTNYVIRRDVVEQLGGWDEEALTEDAEMSIRIYQAGYQIQFIPSSITWEQEPERFYHWFRQRRRWVRGSNYVFRKFARSLLKTRPRRIGWELLYSLSLYYIFFLAVLISDILLVLLATGVVQLSIAGPYSIIWVVAFTTFVLQLIIALGCEPGEDTPKNILLACLMYFTYAQMWIPLVAAGFYDDFVMGRERKWDKTKRYEMAAPK